MNGNEDGDDKEMDFADTPKTTPDIADDKGAMAQEISLTDLRYVSRKGGGTVVIESNSPVTFRTRENGQQNQFVVDIANAHLPDRLKRPYITKDFGQSIQSINAYQDAGSTTAHIVVTFRAPTRATVTQAGKRLLVFPEGPALANGRRLDDSDEIESLAKTASMEGGPTDPRILPNDSTSETNRFYGRPISIEVRDMNVRDVVQLIAEQSGANIVIASGIEGNISLKLKQIPWDQALTIVMKSQNLGYVRQGSVLRIATQKAIKDENDAAKAILDAQVAAEPLKVKIVPVSYATVADLIPQITPFLTKNRGAVVADARTSSLIVTDTPEILDRISNLVKALDTPPLQVLIEGKVVEATEGFTRDFGINWGFTGAQQTFSGKLGLQQNNLQIAPPSNAFGGPLNYNVRLGTFDIFGDLEATLGLAESENLAKVVSAPKITTVNNKKAHIEQSSNIYIPQTSVANGVTTTSQQQVPVTLYLDVTPQVTSKSDILMQLDIKRQFVGEIAQSGTASTGSSGGGGGSAAAPPVETRQTTTNMLVRNGQTAVVGGVYQSDMVQSETGVPGLRNIPIFGWLFKSKSVNNTKNELIVFITPRIISSGEGAQKEGDL